MALDKGKIIAIVQFVFSFVASILSMVALAGGIADNYDNLKSSHWIGRSESGGSVYGGWLHTCIKIDRYGFSSSVTTCVETEWDGKGATTAMGVLSLLFASAYLVLVAVKLFNMFAKKVLAKATNKMLNIIECGVGFLGMIFTLACFAIYAEHNSEHETKPLDNGYDYGPGYGACVSSFVFELIALVLGGISLLPGMATTEVGAPGGVAGTDGAAGHA